MKLPFKQMLESIHNDFNDFNLDNILGFFMGRLFRQCHEVCLIGVRGKVYNKLANKSQRSVHFAPNLKHSAKPEILQDRLELMFPTAQKIEIFGRRDRNGWTVIGNEAPGTFGQDIRNSLADLCK